MSTDSRYLEVSGLSVEIVRKKIKNLHLAVYPPDGMVRVAVPMQTTNENVRLAVISRLGWIKRKQAEFERQPRQSERKFVAGESHYFQGRRYVLEVSERLEKPSVALKNNSKILLSVRPGTPKAARAKIMADWFRGHLRQQVPALLEKWQPVIGREVNGWRIQKMKTKWGSCNISEKRILLNLELAKKSPECLEYILVHELVHLHERHHNERFRTLMDQYMPKWRSYRDLLNNEPLAYENWVY
ncbi:SprT family zinc-dependent metalloprotease [Ochrobactrum sp. Marseille-Q0166]|uniref:M48 family metallopeptidase n=1 Tax=Ochrobactrum sp. Marseille-Q0166 TaxID=2761105 RepID=UPI0016562520|nr:SprT family zinc-dependent metalloprotease [Ochrobactrum sp. Marseille-Q0166]MBC8716801.1 M48 family metallopeptidase [Ochrobactrum sp. Marseille-Q0166]